MIIERMWYYLRIGYATYIAFVLTFLGSTSAFYYLAIKAVPELQTIFTSYTVFLGLMLLSGVPVAITVGKLHFKRSNLFKSEVEIQAESNPFNFRLLPGRERFVINPTQTMINMMLLRLIDRFGQWKSPEEKKAFLELQNRWKWLVEGKDIRTYKPLYDIDIVKILNGMEEGES